MTTQDKSSEVVRSDSSSQLKQGGIAPDAAHRGSHAPDGAPSRVAGPGIEPLCQGPVGGNPNCNKD